MSGGGGGGDGGPNPLRWLISYGDMITNLMIFFLVLYAMSNVEVDRLLVLSDSLKKAIYKTSVDSTQTGTSLLSDPRRSTKTTAVSEAIEEAVRALGLESGVTVSADERGTIISLADSYFFQRGATTIDEKFKPILKEIGDFVRDTNATVQIEGHTDDVDIHRPPIKSNWGLSALRASEVVEFLIKNSKIIPNHISAVGYGDTRPLVPNISEVNRSRNRRVDIVLTNAVIKMKKNKNAEPTTMDILGQDQQIKERIKLLQTENEMGKTNKILEKGEKKEEENKEAH